MGNFYNTGNNFVTVSHGLLTFNETKFFEMCVYNMENKNANF